ncbi:speckle-type POZ protein-like B, partial [Staphylotrichum tortipilum]
MSAAANAEATEATHVSATSTDPDTDNDAAESEFDELQVPSIYAGISALFGSEKFSDMTIRCGGREFKAHRAIVCPQSRFFDRALTGGFAEAATGIVDLPEDDPEVVQRFLEFLYTGTYTDVDSAYAPPSDACMLSAQEIQVELDTPPGVQAVCPYDEEPDQEPDKAENEGEGGLEAELSDTPPAEPDEPDEEYDSGESVNDEVSDAGGNAKSNNPPLPHHRLATQLRELYTQMDTDEKARQLHNDLHPHLELEFFIPLRLYVMADRFDVPALKLLARDRFYRTAERSWRVADCFPDVVDEL